MSSIVEMQPREPKIGRTWFRHGKIKNTILMSIPKEFTKEYHLDQPTNVVITPTPDGLLIKKLEIKQ